MYMYMLVAVGTMPYAGRLYNHTRARADTKHTLINTRTHIDTHSH